ncbi:unnamed protein product [Musa hybrid cultivar]
MLYQGASYLLPLESTLALVHGRIIVFTDSRDKMPWLDVSPKQEVGYIWGYDYENFQRTTSLGHPQSCE